MGIAGFPPAEALGGAGCERRLVLGDLMVMAKPARTRLLMEVEGVGKLE